MPMHLLNYTWKILFVVIVSVFITNQGVSQETDICGVVETFNKYPLRGVKVTARKSDQIATTDSLGRFCIGRETKDKLIFKAKGFYTERVRIKNQDSVTINMTFKGGQKNKKIATGLGYIDEEDLTYAVSSLDNEQKDFSAYSDIYELIQGELAGVDVVNQTIHIRGISSTTDSSPLFVVDGMYKDDISNINPMDVESIQVIKDSSTSKYGSRGAHGVIVITTRMQ